MKYNKLVRDRIPEILDAKGISYEQRIADETEYKKELIKKLSEEVEEFIGDHSTEELADVMEVVEALSKLSDYSEVSDVKIEKRKERGSFDKRIILQGEKE